MAIDKNTQVNDFSKGMNTDVSDALIEKHQYRLANNLRYITNEEENSGELHMIEGATLLNSEIAGSNILAATLLRDIGVIVAQNSRYNDWLVYTIRNGSDKLVCVADIKNGKLDSEKRVVNCKLSLVTRWESEDNAKLYIADGIGPIISIQLLPKDGYILLSLGSVVSYTQVKFRVPKFCGLIDGNLKAGMYEYSYLFYTKNGAQTEISPSTKLIPLHTGALQVDDSSRVQGYEKEAKTNKGIKISIHIGDNNYDRLKIYRVCYEEIGVPPIVGIVFDEDITNEDGTLPQEFEFLDVGKDLLSVVTLEEYNSMTGIHIIPKVIESMTDYMFAANIRNDNPVYQQNELVENWDASSHVTYSFITVDLIGDNNIINSTENPCSSKIDVLDKNNAHVFNLDGVILAAIYDRNENGTLSVTLGQYINLSDFIGGDIDPNPTYANPYVSYALKSLRRGETYRYGIVLYDKYGNASAVKHIDDIKVPDFGEILPFNNYGSLDVGGTYNKLHVFPLGIRFHVNTEDLPEDIVSYEIVRCGKDLSNMSTIMLCVISRPISQIFDKSSLTADIRKQSTGTPLTPTGYITNMDVEYGVNKTSSIYKDNPSNNNTSLNFDYRSHSGEIEDTHIATNSTIINNGQLIILGNDNIYLVISPEYCYQSETVKDMIYKNALELLPISYIYPNKKEKFEVTSVNGGYDGSGTTFNMYNIGNEYANVRILDNDAFLYVSLGSGNTKAMEVNTMQDTIALYYTAYEGTDITLDLGYNDDFSRNYSGTDSSRFAYIKLYSQKKNNLDAIDIASVAFPEQLGWDDFASPKEEWEPICFDKLTGIGGRNFCNWVCGGLYGVVRTELIYDSDPDAYGNKFDDNGLKDTSPAGGIMGPGGKCFVIAVDSKELSKVPDLEIIMGTYLCNIRLKGGGYKEDPKYSIYRSYGNYFDKNTNYADVFDGDCFIQPFEYVALHKWAHPYLTNKRDAAIIYSIPVETNINLAYTHGYEFSKYKDSSSGNLTYIQVNPSNVNNVFIQDSPLYAYNSVYSANSTSKTKAAEGTKADDWLNSKQDYRVYCSVAKSNDELVDNWLKFLPANYLDVDTRYGLITGLRKFANNLVFWQESAAGILSVNERAQITDSTNMPLTLGTAGVLSRYDYMNTSNGMRVDEYADTLSDSTLYWWDHNKHEIVGYSGGTQVVSISKTKYVLNLLNKMANNDKLVDSPLLWYDKLFNEAVFSVFDGENNEKGSLVYSENIGAFSSLYTVLPKAAITFTDSTLVINKDGSIYKWNSLSKSGVKGINNNYLLPYLKYIINDNAAYTKVFDNTEFGGRVYGGSTLNFRTHQYDNPLNKLQFSFTTPLKQSGVINGSKIDNTEYNFRFAIPRDKSSLYGDRLRGKTMQAELRSSSSSYDFSLQYILTKYRISWA